MFQPIVKTVHTDIKLCHVSDGYVYVLRIECKKIISGYLNKNEFIILLLS